MGDMGQVRRTCFSWVTRFKSLSKHAAVTAIISVLLSSDIGYHIPGVSVSIGVTKKKVHSGYPRFKSAQDKSVRDFKGGQIGMSHLY